MLVSPAELGSPHPKTQLGQAGARSVAVTAPGAEGGNKRSGRESQHGKDKAKTSHRLVCVLNVLCACVERGVGGRTEVMCAVAAASTSAHCSCNQRPSAAASEGERLDSLFNSYRLKVVRHHVVSRLPPCDRL